jgi:hypothetical protein
MQEGVIKFYQTGVLDPETKGLLQLKNPEALARMTTGDAPPISEVIQSITPHDETTPAITTPQSITESLAPPPTQPAQLLAPPQSTQPTLAPEFKIPTYTPQTISPGWQQDYTQKMVDILATPQTRTVQPTDQSRMEMLARLYATGQPGATNVANMIKGLTPAAKSEDLAFFQRDPSGYAQYKAAGRAEGGGATLSPGQVRFDAQGRQIASLPEKTPLPKWRQKQIGSKWYMVNENATSMADAIGGLITSDPNNEIKDVVDNKGMITRWITDKNTGESKQTDLPASYPKPEAPDKPKTAPYEPKGLKTDIGIGLSKIRSAPKGKEEETKLKVFQYMAQSYPDQVNRLKTIIWPEKSGTNININDYLNQ